MWLEALEERTLLSLTPIKDINPVSLFPAEITGAGRDVYFVTQAADGGSDLDEKTAAGTTLVKEFHAQDSGLSELTPVGSRLFFLAGVGRSEQLWVTNGTRAGTKLVEIPNSGTYLSHLTAVGDELYFTAAETHGSRVNSLLFETNGTVAGTVPIPMPAGSTGSENVPDSPVAYNGDLYLGFGDRLMKTNGSATEVVRTFGPTHSNAVAAGSVGDLTVAGGVLYFTFSGASQHSEDLYATHGTTRGTALLKDFHNLSLPYSLSNFTTVGTRLFFADNDAADGPSLWVSDGTRSGTMLVTTLGVPSSTGVESPALAGQPILTSTAAGTRLFFTTEPSGPGTATELWVSDGTAAGTTELADINPGNAGPYSDTSGQMVALGGTLYFANDDPTHGVELWQSDGSVAGTRLFLDLNPGPAGSFPGNMAVVGSTLYFSATTAAGSSTLWSSNGTAAGTEVIARFDAQPTGSALFDNIPDAEAVLGNTMIFAATDGTGETQLWKTDGTAVGTSMVKVLLPAPLAYAPSDFTTVAGKLFFVTQSATETLWMTDGTTAGTTAVATFGGTLADLTAFDGKLAFIESSRDGTQSSLWLSDGTVSGTTLVTDFPSLSPNYVAETPTMAALGGKLYISAPPLPGPYNFGLAALWVSDGTAAGTLPVPGAPQSANVDKLAVCQGKLYFSADFPRTRLWVTDGTTAGTTKVANVGPEYDFIDRFLVAGPSLYIFTTDQAPEGQLSEGLYKSDGTAAGTVLFHHFASASLLAAAGLPNGNLAFELNGSSSNPNPPLWVSNGTTKGTKAVKGVRGGFGDGDGYGAIAPIDGRFYLQGENRQYGTGLWQSNGTTAGTIPVPDINSGTGSFYGMALTELNGNLIVAAGDGTNQGLELLSGPMPAATTVVTLRKPSRQ
jgi:ELWxxDGT repeat protein